LSSLRVCAQPDETNVGGGNSESPFSHGCRLLASEKVAIRKRVVLWLFVRAACERRVLTLVLRAFARSSTRLGRRVSIHCMWEGWWGEVGLAAKAAERGLR
jgi:hypothetical protein